MAHIGQMPFLEPKQRELLLAALNSQRQSQREYAESPQTSINPGVFNANPVPNVPLNFEYDHGLSPNQDPDSSLLDDLLAAESNDFADALKELDGDIGGEKRKSPDENADDGDEDEQDGGESKRQENDERAAKKPGRKLLTSEPTTKRKAQNRAAQRAFRERKEKHLKDLESKVADLEAASETANHENGLLRAQIERLQTELKEYRKRVSINGSSLSSSPPQHNFGAASDVNSGFDFNFDFEKFGTLPTPALPRNNSNPNPARLNSWDSAKNRNNFRSHHSSISNSPQPINGLNSFNSATPDSLGSLFSPNANSPLPDLGMGFQHTNSPGGTQNKTLSNVQQMSGSKQTSSPSHSGGSVESPPSTLSYGADSACTSPDPLETWANNYVSGGATNGFATANKLGNNDVQLNSAATDFNFDWLAVQNGGQFDPVLFGDYREPQEAIVGNGADFSGGFFDDNVANPLFPDFSEPFNFNLATDHTISAPAKAPSAQQMAGQQQSSPQVKKGLDLMEQVRRQRDGDCQETKDADAFAKKIHNLTPEQAESRELMTCHKIWNQLQNCPRFKSGDFDIDTLCTELASKAKCTETGVAVPKHFVEQALWKLVGDQNMTEPSKNNVSSTVSQSTGKGGLDAMFPGLA